MGYNIGYCKLVGQQYFMVNGKIVDKDVVFFFQVIGFEFMLEYYSLVIFGWGVIKVYFVNLEDYNYLQAIYVVVSKLEFDFDIMVYEGIGYLGVGGVVDFFNVDVAKMFDVVVVMVVEGGIGCIIDCLIMSMVLFWE